MLRNAILNTGDTFKDLHTGKYDADKMKEWGSDYSDFVKSYNSAKGGDVNAREQLVDATTEMFKDAQGTMSTQDMVSFYAKEGVSGGWEVPGIANFVTGAKGSVDVSAGSMQDTKNEEAIRSDINRSYVNHLIDTSQGNGDFAEDVRNMHDQQRNYAVGQGKESDMKDVIKK